MYKCYYCQYTENSFKAIILHSITDHGESDLKCRYMEDSVLKVLNFKIIPDLCREQGRIITVDKNKRTIHVSRRNVFEKESPFKKISKSESEKEHELCMEENESFDCHTNEEQIACVSNLDLSGEESVFRDLVKLLPDVINALKECGKLDDFVSFHKLVSEQKFPLENISLLLFLDVVRWYSLSTTTTFMRYDDDVKLFWRTGLKLFRGRFLRFMGGPKNKGQILESKAIQGQFSAQKSNVNFVVPDRRVLKENRNYIIDSKPCIITEMIDQVSKGDKSQTLTFKICVDGKKINPSSNGAVNLWGYEDSPTFEMKQEHFRQEQNFFEECLEHLQKQIQFGHKFVTEIVESEKMSVIKRCREAITILSNRIKDLRKLKVMKESLLKKLQLQCEGDWRDSKYVMVISSLRTNIFQTENCIEDMLNINEKLCCIASAALNTSSARNESPEVQLEFQENYVCLGPNSAEYFDNPPLVKQRTETWFKIRESCLVTGSTINKAIGLEGLKNQKSHLEGKKGLQSESVSEALQEKFTYGAENEINAIATMSATFLPVFEPTGVLYEEGCYVLQEDGNNLLVISPDGSVRQKDEDSNILAAIEVKCPFPGKNFTTPIHYDIPKYYVPQVLSEMRCLQVDSLYFVSYGKESTAIHFVTFDDALWTDICNEVKKVDANRIPKKLDVILPELRNKIDNFRQTNVRFIAEVKSKKAIPCEHASDKKGGIYHHVRTPTEQFVNEPLIKDIYKTFTRSLETIGTCFKLCAHKASEVLVFLIADLDRLYKPEIPHAFPVGYALKGYSMKCETMRLMIQDFLQSLFLKGLYTPVVSYDGQWAVLSNKAADGKPLTMLELQKQVYNKVKSRSKADLTKQIFETGVVKSDSFESLLLQVDCEVDTDSHALVVASRKGTRLFKPSVHISSILRASNNKMDNIQSDDSNEISSDINNIVSSLPQQVLLELDNEDIHCLSNVNNRHLENFNSESRPNTIDLENTVFMENTSDSFEVTSNDGSERLNLPIEVEDSLDIATIDDEPIEGEPVVVSLEHEDIMTRSDAKKEILEAMLHGLQRGEKTKLKWCDKTIIDLDHVLNVDDQISKRFSKLEILTCLHSVSDTMQNSKFSFYKSWNKAKLADVLKKALNGEAFHLETKKGKRKRKTPVKLVTLCKRAVNNIPKSTLNAIVAEYEMVSSVEKWRRSSPFTPVTVINGVDMPLVWLTMPEYNANTMSYIFSVLDIHHLITNCRVKVCKDGFPARQIYKRAWIEVARNNMTNLKVSHVEDLSSSTRSS